MPSKKKPLKKSAPKPPKDKMTQDIKGAEEVALSPEEKLAVARYIVVHRLPYFATAIFSLITRWSDKAVDPGGVPTLGVTRNGLLYVHPEAAAKYTQGELAAILVHEIQHVLREHINRQISGAYDPVLFNFAGDMESNDDLLELFDSLNDNQANAASNLHFPRHQDGPDKGKRVGAFPQDEGFPTGKTAEEYYHLLKKKIGKMPKVPGICQGQCGSAAGNAIQNEPEDGNAIQNEPEDGNGRTESELAQIRQATAEAVQKHAKEAGNIPGDWLRWAEQELKPARIPWQRKIARAIRGAISYKSGQVDYTYRRTSRRQWGFGVGPGRPILPSMYAPRPNIAVGVDTSGSMGESELLDAVSEIRGILSACGTEITFLACDAALHSVIPISDYRQVKKHMKGGGGTDFHPILDAVSELKTKPSILVLITDGFGPAPAEPPPGIHVIWLLVGSYVQEPTKWGEYIRLEDV